ncbi:MAG: response regulator [Cephaloticoccus sp.]|nr:response regulator [Cephaloticoccus sp.]
MASILILEDDDMFRGFLADALKSAGHEVREAADGEKGLRMFNAQPADLVLTDIIMPGKEGIATVRELRKAHPGLGIIAMSGGVAINSPLYLDIAQGLGADRKLQKPFRLETLLQTVDEVLAMGNTPRVRTRPKPKEG